jgi:3-oxoacyl-(acyl-carrier-protein) synthase
MSTTEQTRVVVTGMGVVSGIGRDLTSFGQALRDGKSGIRHIPELAELGFSCQVGVRPESLDDALNDYFSPDDQYALSHGMKMTGMAAIDAYRNADLPIPQTDDQQVDPDSGAIVGTGVGGLDVFADKVFEKVKAGRVRRLGSTIVEQIMGSSVSAKLGGLLALGNQVTSNSSACSTGTEAIIMGTERIRHGLAKRMVVGGAEAYHPQIWAGFDAMRVLSRRFNDQPEAASRPLSASAGGFVPAAGAGILVLEDLATAEARGAPIYAEVIGTSITSGGMRNGGSMTAPSPEGVQRCIRQALIAGGVTPQDIDYINGHLTSTFADPLEIANWSQALERSGTDFPRINSTKSLLGHGLGAAGAIESIATILQLKDQFIHPSRNCEDLHPDIEPIAPSVAREFQDMRGQKWTTAAKASFGFGDVNSCLIFRRWS